MAILVFGFSDANCQDLTGLVETVGSFFKSVGFTDLYRYAKRRDSTFYTSHSGDIDVRLSMNLSGSLLNSRGSATGSSPKFRTHLHSESIMNSSVTLGYKGVALGYTFNPFKNDKGKNDHRFSITLYGNFLGLDLSYHDIKSFNGYSSLGEERFDIAQGDPRMKLFLINGFVVFNHKHYSFPAGVGQSYLQRRSSGSLIGGLSFARNRTDVASVGFGEPSITINSKVLSVGAGYGYNYVPRSNVLFSFMLMPKFVIYDSSFVDVNRYDIKQTFKRPELTYSANLAAVRWFGRVFVAATALADAYSSHHTEFGYHLFQLQWQLHAHVGVNF